MENIVEKILAKLNKEYSDIAIKKHGSRVSRSWGELLHALLRGGSIKEAAVILGMTDSSLEHHMSRHIAPIFKDNLYRGKWVNTLLMYINLKRCVGCTEIKEPTYFNRDSNKFDGLSCYCKHCCSVYKKKYALLRPEKIIEYRLISYNKNSSYYKFKAAKYRATKLRATPIWASLLAIQDIYTTCPEGYHVDHIVPLQGALVCGLHCEFNLQHLPAKENLSKGNTYNV
jgi:hypothetical protein